MDGRRDEEDAAAGTGGGGGGTVGGVGGGGGDEVGNGGFEGVVGAQDVDVHDGFEGVGAELVDGGEEVACCAGAGGFCQLGRKSEAMSNWGISCLHHEINASQLPDAFVHCCLQAL